MPGSSPLTVMTYSTVINGYAAALAMVVLLQYAYSVSLRARARRTTTQYLREVEGLSLEVLQLSRERGLQRLENQILREVLSQSDCQRAMGQLLRRIIVNSEDAFGLFMPLSPASDMPVQSRGLSAESVKTISLDHALLQKLRERGALIWSPPTHDSCPIYGQLAPVDRRKARQLFLVGVGDDQGLLGVLLASTLLPIAGSRDEQVELITRLLSSIAPSLRQTLELEQQSIQLRCTREMLELRSLADSKSKNPTIMIEKFLTRLGQMVDAERTSLFVPSREPGLPLQCSTRCGPQMQTGIQARWNEHEEKLARQGFNFGEIAMFDTPQLCRQGIDTLIGSAVAMPLKDADRTLGVVCLTRRTSQGFSTTQRQLLCWAAESLSHSLERAMSLDVIEKQARQDGLTGLANRRTFDEQLASAMQQIRNGQFVECSLLLLDMDRFKSVNDDHGHQVGDAVLREAADAILDEVNQMRSQDRDTALAARYGGEEMALLLPGVGVNGALRIAERLRTAISRIRITCDKGDLKVTVSIGVASAPLHALTGDKLVQSADEALYQAKAAGRNRVLTACEELV